AHVATLMPDGSPQATPVWVDVEGDELVINTAEGRAKARNLRENPSVALSATDPDNPYEAVIVRGWVSEMTHDGADEQIDKLAKTYLDRDTYPFRQRGRCASGLHRAGGGEGRQRVTSDGTWSVYLSGEIHSDWRE